MKRTTTIQTGAAAMWASAFVVGAMIIVQAGRLSGSAAHAEMAVTHGSYTLLTTNMGRGGDADPDELLYIIDSRDQALLVYEVEDARKGGVILRDGKSLDFLFRQARPR